MNTLKTLGIIAGLILLGFLIKLIAFPIAVVNNTLETPKEINNAVMNAENAIYNYEWFKQQEADIRRLVKQEATHKQTLKDYVEMLPKDRLKWTREDRNEWSRLNSNITAQRNMVDKAMEDYNARSQMVSRNIFKDNLPSNLSRSWYAQQGLIFQ